MTTTVSDQWITFGMNMILLSSRRGRGFTAIPSRFARALQRAAAEELGMPTTILADPLRIKQSQVHRVRP